MANAPATTENDHSLPASTPALRRDACKLAEYCNSTWRVVAPRNTPRKRLTQPDWLSVVADQFQAYDVIRVVCEDRSFFAELLVLEAGKGYCQVIELAFHQLPVLLVSGDALPANHTIEHAGPEKLYIVRRLSDGIVLGEGFASRDEAVEFLISHATLR
ncbi:hypothetical protein [Pseudogulbenkiania subflava]|uniref:Uncharacterized protein n=1 Tax=Pseudogulbenkiania subflava DSM 22618 TaxID=1123014 RepID=A0A1Y6CBE4_9NEIS|nr:hypothetical protein [Pseudogulbenkiania subflava]SMF53392.1 hypothetical protein SAMN02745746_03814 [Pseudogulbenkiania subflava DSM 22618]